MLEDLGLTVPPTLPVLPFEFRSLGIDVPVLADILSFSLDVLVLPEFKDAATPLLLGCELGPVVDTKIDLILVIGSLFKCLLCVSICLGCAVAWARDVPERKLSFGFKLSPGTFMRAEGEDMLVDGVTVSLLIRLLVPLVVGTLPDDCTLGRGKDKPLTPGGGEKGWVASGGDDVVDNRDVGSLGVADDNRAELREKGRRESDLVEAGGVAKVGSWDLVEEERVVSLREKDRRLEVERVDEVGVCEGGAFGFRRSMLRFIPRQSEKG